MTLVDRAAGPTLHQETLTVAYGGRVVFLGSGVSFRLLDRLTQAPGWFICLETLADDVWGGREIAGSTVRSAMTRLRQRLEAGGLGVLAAAIDGSEPGRYRIRRVWDGGDFL